METDEKRLGKEAAAALSGGHLCHVCGYQYPNPHPSAKLRRSHRKHCGKAQAAPVPEAEMEGEDKAAVGVGEREERNAVEGTLQGGEGKGEEAGGAREANGGAALRGSAREADESVDGKEIAAHASTGTGVQVIATKICEFGLLNGINSESACPDDIRAQVTNSELSENGLADCNSNSIEIVNEGSGTKLLIACTNGSQIKVGHPAEREDSLDEYQDASPFLHQSDSEDGAAPSSLFSIEINNLNTISSGSSVAANGISLETNGLSKDQISGEPNMTDLSADSEVGYNLENGTLRLAGPEVSLKLGDPYECTMNVESSYTGMVDNKSDKTSSHSESIGDLKASSLHETHPLLLDPELQSPCSGKVKGFMEDSMNDLHSMSEVSPRPEVVGSDHVKLETITDFSTNAMPIGNEWKTDNPTDCSTELLTQNWPVEDTSDIQSAVENSCQENLVCSTTGFQNDLPVTNVDGMLKSIAEDNCSDLDFTFEERPQSDIVEQILEYIPSLEKNGFTKEEFCNKQIDPEVPTEDPFNLDEARNDDLFELPTDSCYLEVPNAVESRQQVDSTSLIVDQPTASNQTRIAEVQHSHNSNESIQSETSASENIQAAGPEDIPVISRAELVKNACLTDAPVDHGLQEDEVRTSSIILVPSQVASMEFSTVSAQDLSALSSNVEENMQVEDAIAKEMTAVRSIDNLEMKQANDTTAKDTYAATVEEKKLTEDTAAEMIEVQHPDYVEEKNQASVTKEASTVQSMGNLKENKETEDTNTKEMNAQFNADDVGEKTQTDGSGAEKTNAIGGTDNFKERMLSQDIRTREMIAAQSTYKAEEKKQTNGEERTNQNEEIAVTGARLNSGRVHVPLKVLLAEASADNKVKKPSTKERVLSFRRRVSKDDNSSVKSGSPKSGSDDQYWSSPARLARKDTGKRSREKKQLWMPFICCHSVH